MESVYDKIEKYLQNLLNNEEKEAFEKELKSNPELQKRFEFYKQLSSEQEGKSKVQDTNLQNKILPTIIESSFSNKGLTKTKQRNPLLFSTLVFAVVLVSAYFFAYLPLNNGYKNSKLAFSKNMDSLENIVKNLNTQIAEFQLTKDTSINPNIVEDGSKLIAEIDNQKDQINKLKKELQETKQALYSNSNIAGNREIKNFKAIKKDRTSMTWSSKHQIQVKIYDLDGNLKTQSKSKVKNEFEFENLPKGFYQIHLIPENSTVEKKIMEVKSSSIQIWE